MIKAFPEFTEEEVYLMGVYFIQFAKMHSKDCQKKSPDCIMCYAWQGANWSITQKREREKNEN